MKGSIRWESANESHMYSWHFNLNFRFTTVCCVDQGGLEYRILLSHMTSGYYSYRHYTHTKVLTLTKTLCVQYLIQGFIHAKQTLLNTYIPKLLCTTGPKQQINITELLKKKMYAANSVVTDCLFLVHFTQILAFCSLSPM